MWLEYVSGSSVVVAKLKQNELKMKYKIIDSIEIFIKKFFKINTSL